ncbi:MAG: hypothetical protein UU81_C0049G0005 [Microgenomates group bacterium GW2011_GWC1_41_8]|uniref:Uncharacterized protein n=2 Tax=Candidatus Roizmaniibacteriota TaxID=1752723 RepID=A0A0G0T8S4_9BACT|nr:MAG: hypothetical protein UU14_C0034G0010 [Candidatus Roizmanbacteria bacterium GW2011_GWB1_40_7]KKR91115.1 MAG: hypothetical protein UU41_C0047G0011 [Candidatus Roizmanbacteria bacterium GW2011_GWA1_41_13]KKS22744.1 MAG: hypothetical protein UU81_C0049G0005 [Microgenomates group bacterium GW2011_GWC1_41_8]
MIIQINSHDALGKLSIVKNYLSVLQSDTSLTDSQKKYIGPAYQATEELIALIKELAMKAKNSQ